MSTMGQENKNGAVKLELLNSDRLDKVESKTFDLATQVASHQTSLANVDKKLDLISDKVDKVVTQVAVLINEKTSKTERKGMWALLFSGAVGALIEILYHSLGK